MPFKTIYKVQPVLDEDNDQYCQDTFCFVEKERLQQALRSKEEYFLAYFLRTSRYQLFRDLPWEGHNQRVFRGSIVEGPREEEPVLPESKPKSRQLETIAKPILKQEFPSQFQRLELLEYGLQVRRPNSPFDHYTNNIDYPQFEQLSREAVRRAQALGQKVAAWGIAREEAGEEKGASSYFGCLRQVNDHLLSISYKEWGSKSDSDRDLELRILGLEPGPGPTGEELIQALNLQELGQVIKDKDPRKRGLYLCNSLRQGLAYNFSLEQFIRELLNDEEGEPRLSDWETFSSEMINSFLGDFDNVIL
ncbi:MAG: hypothetical protein AABX13_05170 [Nanoarchaeota archaeon]